MNRTIPIDVLNLIKAVDQKLPAFKIDGFQQKPELELWCARRVLVTHPTFVKTNHIRQMKLAWLSEGKVGLLNYIEPYIAPNSLNKIRAIILSIR